MKVKVSSRNQQFENSGKVTVKKIRGNEFYFDKSEGL